ncbi:hypothetical protein K443DRAFT_256084 [Laccaria amethystina LaAM-08-1]|uniref:Uncharacterized protein n=1 Tax=Laccaria amethystina LaAM-08-1 TaxID=1095629 RepID=A0A0C9WX51_9AGAR|nr:hypothetical protein K443DRAFT_256084 [Laccaria amethystina LaAM-08-1]
MGSVTGSCVHSPQVISCPFSAFNFTQHNPILNGDQQQDPGLFRAQFISHTEICEALAATCKSTARKRLRVTRLVRRCKLDVNAFISLMQNRTPSFRTCPHSG